MCLLTVLAILVVVGVAVIDLTLVAALGMMALGALLAWFGHNHDCGPVSDEEP